MTSWILPQSLKSRALRRGFTLAELFIALTIFSFLSLSLIYALNISLQVYKREKARDSSFSNIKTTIGLMSRELQKAIVFNNIRLVGTSQSLYFFAPSSFPDMDYAFNKITYQVRETEQKQVIIERKAENPFVTRVEGEEQDNNYTYSYFFSPRVTVITFDFLSPASADQMEEETWQNSWSEESFPRAVRVHFLMTEGPGEKPHDELIILPHILDCIPEEAGQQ